MKDKVLLTSSREPSRRTRSFLKDLSSIAPWIMRVNRGKMTFQELVSLSLEEGASTLLIVGERRGNPSIIRIYDLNDVNEERLPLHAYTIFLTGISLSRERGHAVQGTFTPSGIVIEAKPARREAERNLVLALYKMLGPTNITYDSSEKENLLRVIVSRRRGVYTVAFRYGHQGREIGPLLRIDGVKRVGRHAGPH